VAFVSAYKRIGLLAKLESKESKAQAKKCRALLEKLVDATIVEGSALKKQIRGCDLLLTLGGDGTLLKGARLLLESDAWKNCRLAGINTGRLGFLASIGPGIDVDQLKRLLVSDAEEFSTRSCLRIKVKKKEFDLLNDAVITKGSVSRLFEFRVFVNTQIFANYRADGLIASTPTGSTAYALAAGGAIIEPSVAAYQLTPICPQSFSNKPIVISDANHVRIEVVRSSSDVFLTLDGQISMQVGAHDAIEISRSVKSIMLYEAASSHQASYIHSLRHKLKWGLV